MKGKGQYELNTFFLFKSILVIELRTFHLLGECSTTWATLPVKKIKIKGRTIEFFWEALLLDR
jgi:hypothetical protein